MKRWLIVLAACGGGGGAMDTPGDDQPTPDAAEPAATKFGSVVVQTYTAMQPPGTNVIGGSVGASFSSIGDCTEAPVGSCKLTTCPANHTVTPASAGTLTITGAKLPVSIMPSATKGYSFMVMQKLFDGGETLMMSTTAAEVPALSASVTAASKAMITSPAKPAAATLTINRAAGFTVSWSGGAGSQVMVYLGGGNNASTSLRCTFAASAGSGMIPATTLGMLPAGQGAFAMSAVNDKTIRDGEWSVLLESYYNAVWPDDSIVSGPTMLQ